MAELYPTKRAAEKLAVLLPEENRSLSDESYRFFYFRTDDRATVQRTLRCAWERYKGWQWREDTVTMDDLVKALNPGSDSKKISSIPSDQKLMENLAANYFELCKAPLIVYLGNTAIKAGTIQERILNAYIAFCADAHRRQLEAQDSRRVPYEVSKDGLQIYNRIFFAFYGSDCQIPAHLNAFTAEISYVPLTKEDMHQLLVEYSLRAQGIFDAERAKALKKTLDTQLRTVDAWYANRMAGLQEHEVRRLLNSINIAAHTAGADYTRKDIAEKVIIEYKNRVVLQHDRLKLIETEQSSHVAGLDNIITWLEEHKAAMSDPECAPSGILLIGIPGTGKSATAKEAAHSLDLPMVQLDMSRILGGRVGDSEKGMKEMLEDLKFVAPCVLWIDEIEKAMSGAKGDGGDGGVVQRLFGMLLTFIQENKRPVFTVTTANDIANLPPEFFRNGRFNQTFCLMMPSYRDCLDIMNLKLSFYFQKLGWKECGSAMCERLLEACLGTAEAPRFLTGADIEAHVQELYWRCKGYAKRPSDDELLEKMKQVAREVRTQATPAANHTMEDIAKRYVYMMRRELTMAGKSNNVYTPDRLVLDKVLYYSFDENNPQLPLCMKEPEEFKAFQDPKKCSGSPRSWYDARFFYELAKAMSKVVAMDKDIAFEETRHEYVKLQQHLLK